MKNKTTISRSKAARRISPSEVYANKGLVIEVGRNLGLNFHSCDDLLQEVAIKCWKDRRIVFDPSKGTFAGYLARIARNTAVDMWRKNRHTPMPADDVDFVKMLESEDSFTDATIEREEHIELLDLGIDELYRRFPSKVANDAFVMFSRDGMRANEIARKLGVEERFVNVAVHRGLKRLTDIIRWLEREGLDTHKTRA